MILLAADACLNHNIVRGLRRYRRAAIDIITAQEAGKGESVDPIVLAWAAREGRVLVTHDENTMVRYAWDRVVVGLPMPGLLVCGDGVTVAAAIESLALAVECCQPEDFKDLVLFLPL